MPFFAQSHIDRRIAQVSNVQSLAQAGNPRAAIENCHVGVSWAESVTNHQCTQQCHAPLFATVSEAHL